MPRDLRARAAPVAAQDEAGAHGAQRAGQTTRAQCWLQLGQHARAQQDIEQGAPGSTTPAVARSKWTVAYAQLMAARGSGHGDALARLDALLAQLPSGRCLALWRPQLARLPHLPDAAAIALARQVREEVAAVGRIGLEISAGAHRVERLVRSGQARAALPLAQRTLALLDRHAPDNADRGLVWRQCLPALAAAEPDQYRERLAHAVAWIDDVAQRRVPAPYRASFLERNAANRELRRAASRAGQ